jgi:sugar (pentulose or hexulose) kinase
VRVCLLGLDVGTAAVRGALHDERSGALVAEASAPLELIGRGGVRELDFERAWERVELVLDQLARSVDGGGMVVARVGVAATASTVGTFDDDLRSIGRGILWADHRALREADEIRATGHPVLARTLGHVSPEWGLAKLLYLWRAERSRSQRGQAGGEAATSSRRPPVRFVLELLDWLDWKLTGRLVANAGIREWGWCVGEDGRWPADLVARLDLGEALGLVPADSLPTGSSLGPVRPEIATRHPLLAGATVTMGGMDSYVAALGQGVTLEGRIAASFGNSSSFLAGAAAGDGQGRLYGPFHTVLPGSPGGYWHGGQSTAGLAADWAARLLGRSRPELERLAAEASPGSGGVVFRETLLDRRTPDPEAGLRGVWEGLALAHGPGHLFRAVLEGVAFGARLAIEPLRPREIVVTGGLAGSPLFLGILAEALDRPIGIQRHPLATTLGAAFAHDAKRVVSLNPVIRWAEPTSGSAVRSRTAQRAKAADPAVEAAFERYRSLHRLPRHLSGVPPT